MKVVITGSSGLALNIGNTIAATPHIGNIHIVAHVRVDRSIDWSQYDAFINCAHVDFEQCNLLMDAFESFECF